MPAPVPIPLTRLLGAAEEVAEAVAQEDLHVLLDLKARLGLSRATAIASHAKQRRGVGDPRKGVQAPEEVHQAEQLQV